MRRGHILASKVVLWVETDHTKYVNRLNLLVYFKSFKLLLFCLIILPFTKIYILLTCLSLPYHWCVDLLPLWIVLFCMSNKATLSNIGIGRSHFFRICIHTISVEMHKCVHLFESKQYIDFLFKSKFISNSFLLTEIFAPLAFIYTLMYLFI